MNGLFWMIDKPTEGTEHLLWMKGNHLLQGFNNRMDIFILSHVFHLFANEQIPGKKPSLVWFKKTDMVI